MLCVAWSLATHMDYNSFQPSLADLKFNFLLCQVQNLHSETVRSSSEALELISINLPVRWFLLCKFCLFAWIPSELSCSNCHMECHRQHGTLVLFMTCLKESLSLILSLIRHMKIQETRSQQIKCDFFLFFSGHVGCSEQVFADDCLSKRVGRMSQTFSLNKGSSITLLLPPSASFHEAWMETLLIQSR